MFRLFGAVTDFYDEFMASGDPRVTKWFLMDGPGSTLAIVAVYILFVKVIGPAWMMNRKPFDLRFSMFFYNMALVVINIYLVIQALMVLLTSMDKGLCRRESPNDPDALRLAELGWWFFFLKFVEFVDTIFFVLRKKFQHISKLHVVHHAIVPISVWGGFRVEPASYNYFFPLVNTTVHILMYSYYGLSALGPKVQKYLWWKRYLTTFQMIQFVMVFVYMTLLVLSGCEVSKFELYLNVLVAGLFLVMFYDYFRNTYLSRAARRKPHHQNGVVSSGADISVTSGKKLTMCFNNGVHERIEEEKKIG